MTPPKSDSTGGRTTVDVAGLVVVVVSYNTRGLTLACLRSLFAETRTPLRVVVVDNASTDGSAEAIRGEFPGVELIALEKNVGFAGGNNLAMKGAREEYVLLLNPDTVVLDGAVDRLLAFARERPEAGVWGGRTRFSDGSLNPSSCWERPTPWSVTCQALGLSRCFPGSPLLNPEALGGWARDSVKSVDIVSGCFFLIQRSLWETLGGFDESFFMYGEEADLCLRARALGCRPAVTPDAEIIHYGGASERHRSDKLVRLLSAKVSLIRRHWSPRWAWYGVMMLGVWAVSRAAADAGLSLVTRKGGVHGWPGAWRRRSEWWRGYPGVAA